MQRVRTLCLTALFPLFVNAPSSAQEVGDAAPAGDGGGQTQTQTQVVTPFGYYPAPGTNVDSHLDSGSQSHQDIGQEDTFDLSPKSSGDSTLRGNKDAGAYNPRTGERKGPVLHSVERGDTLWDICAQQFDNPWEWPRIWSFNPQIQNPHWIYPGDQLRLSPVESMAPKTLGSESIVLGQGHTGPLRRALVPPGTIFLRNIGYIDDPSKDVWGELVGAQEERLLLYQGARVYLIMRPGVDVKEGQLLTVFRPVTRNFVAPGARKPNGELISFHGAVQVERWDPKKRIATATLIESLVPVERGAKIGPIQRRFEVVPPKKSNVDLWARILTAMYPHPLYGVDQLVFIDKGAEDGLKKGNRLFVVRRGDTWRRTLETTSEMARTRGVLDTDEWVQVEPTPIHGDDSEFPEETVGEVRLIDVRKQASLAVITRADLDLENGDRLVARKGY